MERSERTALTTQNTSRVGFERLAAAALALVFVALTIDAFVRERGSLDYRIARAVARIDGPGIEHILRFFSALTGSFWAIALWTAFLATALLLRRWLVAAALGMFPLVGGVNTVIRLAVARPRPDLGELELEWATPSDVAQAAVENDYSSFPSGHVVGAVLLWGFAFVLAGEIRNAWLRYTARGACIAVIALSGISRIWLGAHWTGDVVAAYALGGLALLIVAVMYRQLEPTMRGVPLIKAAAVPHDDSLPHAHALTSTIIFRGDEVTKVYNPGFVPRFIYWLSFQARFAYADKPVALEAAVARRNLAGKLTEYWFGRNAVAEALRVERIGGRLAITGRFTDGVDPKDHDRARKFLFELADRFDEAGLPTWQIDPRQPRSIGNLLETPGGNYTIIDLESGLVSPLVSPRAWLRAIRRALVPMYDDVYFDVTRKYVEREAEAMTAAMGADWLEDVRRRVEEADALATAWHSAEPRIWSRALAMAMGGFGTVALVRWVRRKTGSGRAKAEEWLEESITTWRSQGRISEEQELQLREQVATPEFQGVLPHFGVHLIIGVALRFPFGSITRATYTTANLVIAAARFATRRIDGEAWRRARRIHSPLVILISAMPGIGTFAYVASAPVRSNHLLVRVVFDSVGEKLPFKVYRRLGIRRLVAGREARAEA